MTATFTSALRTTGATTGLLEEIHDLMLPDFMTGIKRLIDSGDTPAIAFYPGHIDLLKTQFGTVYGTIAALWINGLDSKLIKEARISREKPVDVYRKYSSALRSIAARHTHNSGNALDTLRSLYLEQTRPDGELEGQQWIDGYTGEAESIDEALEVGKACDKFLAAPIVAPDPKGEMAQATHQLACAEYADTMVHNILLAKNKQEISMLLKITKKMAPEEFADVKAIIPVPPTKGMEWFQATTVADHQSAQSGFDGEVEAVDEDPEEHNQAEWGLDYEKENSFHDHEVTFKSGDTLTDMDEALAKELRIANARVRILQSAAKKYAKGDKAKYAKDLKLRCERIMPAVVRAFIHATPFLDDDIQEEMASLLLRGIEVPMSEAKTSIEKKPVFTEPIGEGDADRVDPNFFTDLAGTYEAIDARKYGMVKEYKGDMQNAINTPDYNVTKIQSIAGGATTDEADKVAFIAWKNHKSKVKSIMGSKTGLILDSGRQISFKIAQMKLASDELDISADEKTRLIKALISLKVGSDFIAALQK